MNYDSTLPDREIVTSRVLNHSKEKVWKVMTDPKLLAQWWGPNGFSNTFKKFELRPGGEWDFIMHGPNGVDYANHHTFKHIVPGKRLDSVHDVAPVFQVILTLDEMGPTRTKCTFRMLFETDELCNSIKSYCLEPNEQNFDRMEKVLSDVL